MIVGLETTRRRSFASALEWPGWTRAGKTEEAALEALDAYAERYRVVAGRAGLSLPERAGFEVVERIEGNATTDFGAPGGHFGFDDEPVDRSELTRAADLLRAAWGYLDAVVASAPAELRKGPRGGGRDRDAVALHVAGADVEYGRKLGLERWKPESATPAEIAARREAVAAVFAAASSGAAVVEKGWPLRYAARRGVWHILDHAWEIEDRSQ